MNDLTLSIFDRLHDLLDRCDAPRRDDDERLLDTEQRLAWLANDLEERREPERAAAWVREAKVCACGVSYLPDFGELPCHEEVGP